MFIMCYAASFTAETSIRKTNFDNYLGYVGGHIVWNNQVLPYHFLPFLPRIACRPQRLHSRNIVKV
jgi:hypothetical protein